MYTSTTGLEHYSVSPEDQQAMFCIADWITNHRRSVKKIRQLAGTEECYLLVIKEIDRLGSQLGKARYFGAEATLTLVEWLETLEYFHWQCAFCGERPFQVLRHVTPLPIGGTTVENCMPACYRCIRQKRRDHPAVVAYLAHRKRRGQGEAKATVS
jgi:hypothetical protein